MNLAPLAINPAELRAVSDKQQEKALAIEGGAGKQAEAEGRETKKEMWAHWSDSLKDHLCLCCNTCKFACREFHKQGSLF